MTIYNKPITEAITGADERIKSFRVVNGPGSDGPYVQPDYYLYLIFVDSEEETKFDIYPKPYIMTYFIQKRGIQDELIDNLNKQIEMSVKRY